MAQQQRTPVPYWGPNFDLTPQFGAAYGTNVPGTVAGQPGFIPGYSPLMGLATGGLNNLATMLTHAIAPTSNFLATGQTSLPPTAAPVGASPPTLSFQGLPSLNYGAGMTPASYIFGPESGGDNNAANPNSSARGAGQFLDNTWMDKDLRKRAGFETISDQEWKKKRTDPAANVAMTNAYAARNSEMWTQEFGQPPTPGAIYSMHVLDGKGGIKLAKEAARDPAQSAAALFPKEAAANPNIFYKPSARGRAPLTVAEVQAKIAAKVGDSDPFQQPGLPRMDPNQLAGMVPLPSKPADVKLPAPPPRAAIQERPPEELIDTPSILDQLRLFAPKDFDEAGNRKKLLPAILTGIATGAASVDARRGAGAVLAAIGAGASQASAAWTENTTNKREAHDEATRLYNLALAREGIDLNEQNRAIRTRNKDKVWQTEVDKAQKTAQEAQDTYQTSLQETLKNIDRADEYRQAFDAYNMQVFRTKMGAVEYNAQQTANELTGQQTLDLKRFLYEDEKGTKLVDDGTVKAASKLLSSTGMMVNPSDPKSLNALQGSVYIYKGNVPGAMNAFGRELAMTGAWRGHVGPALEKDLDKLSTTFLQKHSGDSKAEAALNELIGAELGRRLALAPDLGWQLAQEFAPNDPVTGKPSSQLAMAQLLAQYLKPNAPATGAANAR